MFCAIIVAAGSSRRMGFDKLFAELGGRPVVAWSVSAFQDCAEVSDIVIVTQPEKEPRLREQAERWQWTKLRAIVPGGELRHLSVWNGLQSVAGLAADTPEGHDAYVAVQDGARPLVTPAMIARCLQAAKTGGAACCAAPVSDTLKRVDADKQVTGSVDRADLWAMQTPQIFPLAALQHAYRKLLEAGLTVTDEASAMERIGQPVVLVNSGDFNLKVTYPDDLELCRHLLAMRSAGD